MELIASIPLIGGVLSIVIPFLIVLGIVVFVHEYGHYIVGRWCGIHAEVFSVGYGKPLKSWVDKRGTVWQIAVLPLGGYVKFVGDSNAASFNDGTELEGLDQGKLAHSFPTASVGRRAATVAAGPIANFILSTIVFGGVFMWQGQATETPTIADIRVPLAPQHDVRPGDQILAVAGTDVADFGDVYSALKDMPDKGDVSLTVLRDGARREVVSPYLLPPLVAGVQPLSPASNAGIKAGDLILTISGTPLRAFEELRDIVLASEGVELDLVVLRDGAELPLKITPEVTETEAAEGGFEKRVMIGVASSLAIEPMTETPGLHTAIWFGMVRVYDVIVGSINGLAHIITGSLSAKNLQGPIGIAQISGDMANQGLMNFINLIALISTAIGMLNLFPIPILDGGHLAMFAYESVTGRPPHEKFLNVAMSIGFVLLMALMIFATYNDIMKI